MSRLVRADEKIVVRHPLVSMVSRKACHNACDISVDGLQQQKTASGSTLVSQEQKSEAAVSTSSSKLDTLRFVKRTRHISEYNLSGQNGSAPFYSDLNRPPHEHCKADIMKVVDYVVFSVQH